MNYKPFSIIVLSHNNIYIDYCIESIKKYKKPEDEIIVIDDHSTETNYEKLLKHIDQKCKIIRNSTHPHNLSFSRNIGTDISQYERFLFIDGDAFFYDDCIEQLRSALDEQNVVCATAYADAMSIAPLQLELVYKENFTQHIKTGTLAGIVSKHFLRDFRRELSVLTLNNEHNWMYFYGICLAVKKNAFIKAGRFDDSLSGWGIEDIDFTYRLCRYGKLRFVTTAHLFHLPHNRNRYDNYMHDAYNFFECLKKYYELEWELSYRFSNLQDVLAIMDDVLYRHRNVHYQLPIEEKTNSLYINALSGEYPHGNVLAYNKDGKPFEFQLLGTCLPFSNKKFDVCYLSNYVVNYPAPVLSVLLQELCRVSYKVLIPKVILTPCFRWGKSEERKCKLRTKRFEVFPVQLSDFIFTETNKYYNIETGLPDAPYPKEWEVFYELI